MEKSLSRIILTFQDITQRKNLELKLQKQAQIDSLTKLLNHKAIFRSLKCEIARAHKYQLNMSCLMIDVDGFKKVNDNFGHLKGDRVLRHVADILRKTLRKSDVIGRYGGDEFLIILPETPPESAKIAAKRICDLTQSLAGSPEKSSQYVTVSIGVGGRPSQNVRSAHELITKIDKALYAAKKNGRSRIVSI